MSTIHSVHVTGEDNSQKFKDHVKGWGGEHHYTSDKGVAYKFKKDYQARGFAAGIKTGFKHLDAENDGEMHEEVQMEELHPIHKEYNDLKKHDIKTLRGMIKGGNRVHDTSEYKTKDHAITKILTDRHGRKKMDQVFGEEAAVPTNSMSSGAIANPNNKPLFGKPMKRKSFKEFMKGK